MINQVVVIVLNVFNLCLLCISWDQWLSSQPSPTKMPEMKSGGMKASTSAPSRLPSAKTPQKDSLFDDDDDDLFAATKEQR